MRRDDPAPGVLSVVIPVFNEEATIGSVIVRTLAIPHLRELIVSDDGSTDETVAIARAAAVADPRITVLAHHRNRGKTAALRDGFAATTGDVVIVQDADLEYDPSEIAEVIRPILDDKADVVYGSRFRSLHASRVLYFHHYLANQLVTFLSNCLTNINLTDVETGYKAFRGEIIRNMIISSARFGFEIEVTAKVAKLGCRIYETPISYYGRTYEEGKKIGLRDGLEAIWLVFRYNLFTSVARSYRDLPGARGAAAVRRSPALEPGPADARDPKAAPQP